MSDSPEEEEFRRALGSSSFLADHGTRLVQGAGVLGMGIGAAIGGSKEMVGLAVGLAAVTWLVVSQLRTR